LLIPGNGSGKTALRRNQQAWQEGMINLAA